MDSNEIPNVIEGHLFPLGQILITARALKTLKRRDVILAIGRHARGDWGDISDHECKLNVLALDQGFTLLSAYMSSDGSHRFHVITEHDRSVTTVLFPDEY